MEELFVPEVGFFEALGISFYFPSAYSVVAWSR